MADQNQRKVTNLAVGWWNTTLNQLECYGVHVRGTDGGLVSNRLWGVLVSPVRFFGEIPPVDRLHGVGDSLGLDNLFLQHVIHQFIVAGTGTPPSHPFALSCNWEFRSKSPYVMTFQLDHHPLSNGTRGKYTIPS